MSLHLDGSTGCLEFPGALTTAYPFSMMVWVSIDAYPAGNHYWVTQSRAAADGGFDLLYNQGGTTDEYAISRIPGNTAYANHSGAPYPDTTMKLAVAVFTSATSRTLYFASSTGATDTTSFANDPSLLGITVVGAKNVSGTRSAWQNGNVAEAHFFNVALTSANVSALLADTVKPEAITGWVDGWTFRDYSSGGTYASIGGTRTMTAVGGVIAGTASHPIARAAPPDTTAPTLSSAVVANATPTVVTLTMSEAMDTGNVPAASAFAVTGHTVSSVSISGSVISLTCSAAFVYGEAARTVSYTQPGTAKARDLAGNLLANFSAQAITNNVAAGDTTKPAFAGALVANGARSDIVITMSETLAAFTPAASAFAVSGGRTVSSVARSGATLTLTVSAPYAYGDAITVAYTKPGVNMLQDAAGNQTDTFTAQSVTNMIAGATGVFTTDQWINNAGSLRANEVVSYTWYSGGAIGSAGGTPTTGNSTLSSLGVLSLSGLPAGVGYLLGKSADGGVFYQAGTVV